MKNTFVIMAVSAAAALECWGADVVEANGPNITAVVVNSSHADVRGENRENVSSKSVLAGRVTEVRDEHVEVIDDKLELVTTTTKRTESRIVQPAPEPEGVVVAAAVVAVVPEPESFEPPASESAEARRLVRYFCKCWKDGDYLHMWWAMTPQYRLKAKYEEFLAVFADDAKANGGLLDENIGPHEHHDDWGVALDVVLRFRLRRADARRVRAFCEQTKDGYRIGECGLVPLDMRNL